ncbi:amino acid kinase family protein [Alishewanella longhuensis]
MFSSIGIGSEGQLLNVNADLAAAAICQLVKGQLVLLTDVPGILDGNMQLIPELSTEHAAQLVAQGVIKGGMKVKLDAALDTAAALKSNIVVAGWQNPDDLMNLMQDKPDGHLYFVLTQAPKARPWAPVFCTNPGAKGALAIRIPLSG